MEASQGYVCRAPGINNKKVVSGSGNDDEGTGWKWYEVLSFIDDKNNPLRYVFYTYYIKHICIGDLDNEQMNCQITFF